MAEELLILSTTDKRQQYESLIPQIKGLISGEPNLIANLANVSAALKAAFGHLWIGFYLVEGDELVLGPFQGPIACTRIKKGKGVCGAVFEQGKTIIVPDVDVFPGHIACSSDSKSEIVLPVRSANGELIGVLDIDSSALDTFDAVDQEYLEKVLDLF